jgi:fructose-1,6-bisphosphatase
MSLTKEQQKELEILAAEIEAEAIQMKIDYEQTPSEESGSVVVVHENSEWLDIAQDIDESDKDKPMNWDEEE